MFCIQYFSSVCTETSTHRLYHESRFNYFPGAILSCLKCNTDGSGFKLLTDENVFMGYSLFASLFLPPFYKHFEVIIVHVVWDMQEQKCDRAWYLILEIVVRNIFKTDWYFISFRLCENGICRCLKLLVHNLQNFGFSLTFLSIFSSWKTYFEHTHESKENKK